MAAVPGATTMSRTLRPRGSVDRFRHPQVKHRWSKDYSAFKRLGYVVERRHMCRACKRPATRGCCENYSHANRSHVDVIMNIVCVEEFTERDEAE